LKFVTDASGTVTKYWCEPAYWNEGTQQLSAITAKQFMQQCPMDMYLHTIAVHWREVNKAYYVPLEVANAREIRREGKTVTYNARDDNEPEFFRRLYSFEDLDQLPIRPLVRFVHRGNHFYTVAFDFVSMRCYVFGNQLVETRGPLGVEKHQNWQDWHGPEIWRRSLTLLGLRVRNYPPSKVKVFQMNWKQVRVWPPPCQRYYSRWALLEWL
jgi:hypothetical protein